MRIAVAGGTGMVGRYAITAVHDAGHDAVTIARSTGSDLTTGAGVDAALDGVDAVIDVTNTQATDPDELLRFFGTTTSTLLAAEERAGVRLHVLLSIVGIDRVEGNAHYAGKRRQEELVAAGPVPYTIARATQFFEFAEMVVGWTTQDGRAAVAPLLLQPAAAADVAAELVQIAQQDPLRRVTEIAGPETADLVDLARRALAVRGADVTLVPGWRNGPFTTEMAGEALLPGPEAFITSTTFDEWLATPRRGQGPQ